MPEDEPPLATDELGLSRLELLGKRLFEDTSLSEPKGQSCAACHDASRAFTGDGGSPLPAVAIGADGRSLGTRNVPTLMYASRIPPLQVRPEESETSAGYRVVPFGGLFWDGRADSLEAQAEGPLFNPREMANTDADALAAKLRSGAHAQLLVELFGPDTLSDGPRSVAAVSAAIAAYERSARFSPFRSRLDDWLRGEGELTEQEQRGLALFVDPDKGNCASCHAVDPTSRDLQDWPLTNWGYEVLGVPRNEDLPDNSDPSHFDLGLCDALTPERLPYLHDPDAFCGAFRVPTLRNVARTGPYFHNGVFDDLREVVRFYALRDVSPEDFYPRPNPAPDDLPAPLRDNVNRAEPPYDRRPGQAPRLNDEEIDAIVAFLEALSDR